MFKKNLLKLREKMRQDNIDLAVITDDDNLYYFTGYHNFVHMEFGRPTILLVPKEFKSPEFSMTPTNRASMNTSRKFRKGGRPEIGRASCRERV